MKILIIEDDVSLRNELAYLLEQNNYKIEIVSDFDNLPFKIVDLEADLILMDINLPYEDGFKLARLFNKTKKIPIIFVTSRNTDEDELMSIKSGGIDFVTKPYNKLLLLEKIKRALEVNNPTKHKEITKHNLTLDLHLSLLKYQDKEIELSRNEFRILYYFFTNDDRIITKDELIEYLWNEKYYLDENILTVNINRLRKRAKLIGIDELIKTIRGEGYSL